MRRKFVCFVVCVALAVFASGCEDSPPTGANSQPAAANVNSPAPTAVSPAQGAALTTAKSNEFGQYVADSEGRALYLFTPDSSGESSCYEACAQAWPPLFSTGTPKAGDSTIRQDLIGTIKRRDGAMQVTYNGHPLYYYVKDSGAGQVTGQDVKSFGGEWYLLTPQGEKLEKH